MLVFSFKIFKLIVDFLVNFFSIVLERFFGYFFNDSSNIFYRTLTVFFNFVFYVTELCSNNEPFVGRLRGRGVGRRFSRWSCGFIWWFFCTGLAFGVLGFVDLVDIPLAGIVKYLWIVLLIQMVVTINRSRAVYEWMRCRLVSEIYQSFWIRRDSNFHKCFVTWETPNHIEKNHSVITIIARISRFLLYRDRFSHFLPLAKKSKCWFFLLAKMNYHSLIFFICN